MRLRWLLSSLALFVPIALSDAANALNNNGGNANQADDCIAAMYACYDKCTGTDVQKASCRFDCAIAATKCPNAGAAAIKNKTNLPKTKVLPKSN